LSSISLAANSIFSQLTAVPYNSRLILRSSSVSPADHGCLSGDMHGTMTWWLWPWFAIKMLPIRRPAVPPSHIATSGTPCLCNECIHFNEVSK